MKNQGSKVGIVVLTVIITAVVIGGGVFFLQQNSIKKLQEEVQNTQTTNDEKTTTTKDITTPETKENITSLPTGVEWLTYNDNDLSFVYPKTFLGTPLQDPLDENMGRTEWKVSRQDNTIYIRPNFESPAAEFGATYEIKVLKDTWAAEKEWQQAGELHDGPESQWGQKLTTKATNYYVGVLRNLDFGLGQIFDVYTLVPGGIDGRAKSKKPLEKHFIIYAAPNVYQSYVEDILIPSIKAK